VDRLSADEQALQEGLPLWALRPVLPRDRSNRRRVIQSLKARGDVEEITDPETGERRLRLGWLVGLRAMVRQQHPEWLDDDDW
jgi:hypothetical protein